MAKIREISSIEHGLAEAIKNLKAELIEKATGKSESFIRKCSDPDDKDHNLHLADAIKLDMLSLKSQNGSPFLDNISLIVNNEFNDQEKLEDVSRNLIAIGGRIRNLMDTTEQALHPDSPNGEEIAKNEKDKIFNAISQVEEKIARLKLSIK